MALATRCPECETIFRISTTQAAIKSGMVRCGQCRHVFNSLDALVRVEDLDVVEEIVADAAPALSAPGVDPRHGGDSGLDATLAPGGSVGEDVAAFEEGASEAGSSGADATEEVVPGKWWLPQGGRAAAASAGRPDAPRIAPQESSGRSLSDRRVSLNWPADSHDARQPEFLRTDPPRAQRSRGERWALAILSIVAALGLAAQAAYVWRDEVAARWPAAKPWLVAACAPLRCMVDYPAHRDAITIESAALQSSTPNSNLYTLTALLRNRDTVAVRYPYLELTLTDTQDRPVLRRALRPEDYLGPALAADGRASRGFSAGSELPIRVMFQLDDLRFVGYRLERFYP